jgi:3-oxoacyl-[acyl-carrier protein] reductase
VERGASVVCADNTTEKCETSVALALATGGDAIPVLLDVRDPSQVTAAVAIGLSQWGKLSGLVNCVGITGQTGVITEEVDLADFRAVLDVNLIGAFLLTREVLPTLGAAGYGRILHIASIAGKEGNAGMAAYSASKAGLIGMVKATAKEYATYGITINALAPAVIWTPMVESMPPHQVEYMTQRIPMKRLGSLEEVAEIAAWIVSPGASFTTGFTFDLSGGRATY